MFSCCDSWVLVVVLTEQGGIPFPPEGGGWEACWEVASPFPYFIEVSFLETSLLFLVPVVSGKRKKKVSVRTIASSGGVWVWGPKSLNKILKQEDQGRGPQNPQNPWLA